MIALARTPAGAFPYARCATCAREDGCVALGGEPPDFPGCFAPLLRVRTDRVGALLARLDRGAPAPALRPLREAIVAHLGGARHRWSETFEASVSVDASGVRDHRYVYGVHDLAASSSIGVRDAIGRVADALGGEARTVCDRVLRTARHRAVDLLLVGADVDRGGEPSLKLYLQLRRDAGALGSELARGLLEPDEAGGRVHLLGVAIGPSGVRAAKAYFEHDELASEPLFESLGVGAPFGPTVRGAIVATKLAWSGAASAVRTREIFVPLVPNDLRAEALRRWTAIPYLGAALDALEPLRAAAKLAIRGVTFGVPPAAKANVYYTVTDVDPS